MGPEGRLVGRTLLLAVLLTAASACARGGASPPAVLRVGTTADDYVTTKDASRLAMYPLNTNVAEPLVRLRPDYGVEPALAERWEFRPPNTWRFHLRQDVRFHDGRPLTAEAVQWSFGRVARSETGTSFMSEASTVVIDPHTVDVTPTLPNRRLIEQLVHPTYAIVGAGTEPGVRVVGTGPFGVTAYRRGEYIRVSRFEGYWGPRPSLEGIEFRFFPDPASRLLALFSGDVDLVTDVPREQVAALATGARDIVIMRSPVGQTLLLYLNRHGKPPYVAFSEPHVRRAVALAIDRQALVTQIWNGEGVVAQSMAPPQVLGDAAATVQGFPTAVSEAKALLSQGGWTPGPDGIRTRGDQRLSVTILARRDTSMGTGELLHAQLRQIGMDVSLAELPDLASYQARLRTGEFDAALEAPNQNDANPSFLPALRLFSRSPNPTVRWFLLDDAFDDFVRRALDSATTDEARHWAARAMRRAIDEDVTVVPLAGLRRIFAARSHVIGLVPHPSFTSQSWQEIRLERE